MLKSSGIQNGQATMQRFALQTFRKGLTYAATDIVWLSRVIRARCIYTIFSMFRKFRWQSIHLSCILLSSRHFSCMRILKRIGGFMIRYSPIVHHLVGLGHFWRADVRVLFLLVSSKEYGPS